MSSSEDKKNKNKDQYGIKVKKLKKQLYKFLQAYQGEIADFYELFEELDIGNEIETSEMENSEIRSMLEKIFQIIKIKNVGSKEQPKFKRVLTKKTKSLNLVSYIKDHFYHLMSDGEEVQVDKKKQQEIQQNKKIQKSDDDFNLMMQMIAGKEQNKLGSLLNHRGRNIEAPLPPQKRTLENQQIQYLGAVNVQTKTAEDLREEMDLYDQQFRGKSLMELHQEKKSLMKQKVHHKQRQEFSREDEFTLSHRCSSSEMLRQIKQSGNSFSQRFTSGSIENQFI